MDIEKVEQTEKSGCVNCNHPIIDNAGPTALCHGCRSQFIKFPIPLWIKIFGAVVGVVFLFSMYNLPKTLGVAIHLEKGKKAEKQSNYLTAQKEFDMVVQGFPANSEAKAHLMIADFYNQDLASFFETYKEIQGQHIEDDDLMSKLQSVIAESAAYVPKDSLSALLEKHSADSITDKELLAVLAKNPDDLYGKLLYASKLFNREDYAATDSVLTEVLALKPDHISAILIKATVKRELGQIDSSLAYCEKAIAINHENTYMLSSKARTLLKQHKDAESLALALETYKMNEKDYYSLATTVLAYHFNNKIKERDEMIKKAALDTMAGGYMEYPLNVIKGVQKFRD